MADDCRFNCSQHSARALVACGHGATVASLILVSTTPALESSSVEPAPSSAVVAPCIAAPVLRIAAPGQRTAEPRRPEQIEHPTKTKHQILRLKCVESVAVRITTADAVNRALHGTHIEKAVRKFKLKVLIDCVAQTGVNGPSQVPVGNARAYPSPPVGIPTSENPASVLAAVPMPAPTNGVSPHQVKRST